MKVFLECLMVPSEGSLSALLNSALPTSTALRVPTDVYSNLDDNDRAIAAYIINVLLKNEFDDDVYNLVYGDTLGGVRVDITTTDQSKVCFKCGETKPLTEYYRHSAMADGRLNKCKACTKADANANPNDPVYARTEKGVIRVIYKTQRANSKKRGHSKPTYTKVELKDWLYENGFKALHDAWVAKGYRKDDKPSCDRLDTLSEYSLDNLRLVTWKENRDSQYVDIREGRGTSGKRCKAVEQLKDGKLVNTFVSYSSAARAIGYSFERQIKKGIRCRKGYHWRYKK